MIRRHDENLLSVLGRFRLHEVLRGDLAVGVLGGVGAAVLAQTRPILVTAMSAVAVGLIGVVIGAVLAAASLIVAFLDPGFLRKLRMIDEDPVDYLAPYLFTGVLATVGSLLAIALAATSPTAPTWWLVPLSGAVGLFGGWAIASIIPNFTNVIRFIRLQQDASAVPDDLPTIQPRDEHHQSGG